MEPVECPRDLRSFILSKYSFCGVHSTEYRGRCMNYCMLCWYCGQACLKLALTSADPHEGRSRISHLLLTSGNPLGILTPFGFTLRLADSSFTSSGIEMAHLSGAVLYLRCAQPSHRMSRNFCTIQLTTLAPLERSLFMTCWREAPIVAS